MEISKEHQEWIDLIKRLGELKHESKSRGKNEHMIYSGIEGTLLWNELFTKQFNKLKNEKRKQT